MPRTASFRRRFDRVEAADRALPARCADEDGALRIRTRGQPMRWRPLTPWRRALQSVLAHSWAIEHYDRTFVRFSSGTHELGPDAHEWRYLRTHREWSLVS